MIDATKLPDFLIVTSTLEELDAVLRHLSDVRRLPPDEADIRIYFRGELAISALIAEPARYQIVGVAIAGAGRLDASNTTADAVRRWGPRFVLSLGTASGYGDNVEVGDILIAQQVVDYEIQAPRKPGAGDPPGPLGDRPHYRVYAADPRLLGAAQHLRTLPTSACVTENVANPVVRRHLGALISGDKVSLNSAALTRYAQEWPELIGLETEASGVSTAVFQAAGRPGLLVIRGVCQLTEGAEPTAESLLRASMAAVDYSLKLLSLGPIPLRRASSQSALDDLHEAFQALQREQLRRVSRGNYLPALYVERELDQRLREFVDSESRFAAQAQPILADLFEINARYGLNADLAALGQAIESAAGDAEVTRLIDGIRQAFYHDEVEAAQRLIEAAITIQETSDARLPEQVERAFAAIAGLPFVYREGPVEKAKQRSWLMDQLARSIEEQRGARGRTAGKPPHREPRWLAELFPLLRADKDRPQKSANALIAELVRLRELAAARCLAIVGPAGCGKTNTLCHAMHSLGPMHPTLLVAGQIEGVSRLGIEAYLRSRLETVHLGLQLNWLRLIEEPLRTAGRWLIVLVDAVNEAMKLHEMLGALKDFLASIHGCRIKLIVSCRDIFWDYFEPHLKPDLFGGQALRQSGFKGAEETAALRRYFDHFNITCTLDEATQAQLRFPLLLRFFCEANRGRFFEHIGALDLIEVFDKYVEQACTSISRRLDLINSRSVLLQLLSIATAMWQGRTTVLPIQQLGLTMSEIANPESIYTLLRAESVIFEETAGRYGDVVSIRFVYDQFMEYMLARSWAARLPVGTALSSAADSILDEAAASILEFGPVLGALVFTDKVLKLGGLLLNRAIPRLIAKAPTLVQTRQESLLFAFKHIHIETAEDALIDHLDAFEEAAHQSVKEGLASIILALLEHNTGHPKLQRIAGRMLEIDAAVQPQAARPEGWLAAILTLTELSNLTKLSALPPARYHYTEQTRLAAISLLASSGSAQSHELVAQGTLQLGRMELTSALLAVTALDRAEDSFVLQTIPRYLDAIASEYRIYCAWLLRQRYGKEAADFLLRLLTDAETRVHEYAFDLFRRRAVDSELRSAMLHRLEADKTLRPWHLLHLVRLMSRRPSNLVEVFPDEQLRRRTVRMLSRLADHSFQLVREAAQQGLVAHGSG